jgi:hypothetical protein
LQNEASGRLSAQRDFGAVDAKYAGVAQGRSLGGGHRSARQETEFHQPPSVIGRQINPVQNAFFALPQVGYCHCNFSVAGVSGTPVLKLSCKLSLV